MYRSDNPDTPTTTYLKDYRPPAFLIDNTDLIIDLQEDHSLVRGVLDIRRNPNAKATPDSDLLLDIDNLEILGCSINGQDLDNWTADERTLCIPDVPDAFRLTTLVRIHPEKNSTLMGLYKSRNMFCTQCEAEGFRRITPYLDRPDVLSRFTTRITADKTRYPILLSNGNLVDHIDLDSNRHQVTWQDPFRKPSYLFAMVAGDLAHISDQFVTMSGRRVDIRIYVEEKDLDKCDHALRSLKHAMLWDEQVFGREYDLDIFMIVAVDDFNMGAMENKGLNIFNTSAVLTNPAITTDQRFQWVEAVVAHEYFHNWSGNRVTCRDWFQLSLKEGFTVYRDSEFSADMNSRTLKRIETVRNLRAYQFAEDAGPLAHPVQPQSYQEINNFYTQTVYEKGAEVVRMQATLLGPELFRAGTDLYFERYDGQAVTIEDFVSCMAEVSERDLTQFMNWYRQAGTPKLSVKDHYDAAQKTYRLEFTQSCPPTPEMAEKNPFVIPVKTGLIVSGRDIPLYSSGLSDGQSECIIEINKKSQSIVFNDISEKPTPSLLRDFSAPVILDYDYSKAQLLELMKFDSNGFNRWTAAQQLSRSELAHLQIALEAGENASFDQQIIEAWADLLADSSLDPAMVASLILLPSMEALVEGDRQIRLDSIFAAREKARADIASALNENLSARYQELQTDGPYEPSAEQIGSRSLKNICLTYWLLSNPDQALEHCWNQYIAADNMTDIAAALTAMVNSPHPSVQEHSDKALSLFYDRWKHEALVVNQWLAIQSGQISPDTLQRVQKLLQHPGYDGKNPNKIRSLIGGFCTLNPHNFHHTDGGGYRFLAEQIMELDRINPQIAARLVNPLCKWKNFADERSALMREQLQRIASQPKLSSDLREVVDKSLAQS